MAVLRSKNVIKAIEDFAKKNKITHMLMGASPESSKKESKNITFKLQNGLPKVEFIIL